jgi:MOSC domain-containing protein YiiM
MSGIVRAIYLAEAAGAALAETKEAKALIGRGLEGDRYERGVGSFSRWPGTGRAVTLIEQEVIDAVQDEAGLDLDSGRSRRNVVTEGIRLNELVGKTFRIGTALFRGERLAEPCEYLQRRVGDGLMAALKGRGGLRADVLEEGVIRAGDEILVVERARSGQGAPA